VPGYWLSVTIIFACTGVTGSGIGVLAITNGIIVGADMVGGRFDGTYKESSVVAGAKEKSEYAQKTGIHKH
jgi:hypothetical protein